MSSRTNQITVVLGRERISITELSYGKFELIKDKYWVSDFISEHSSKEYKNERWCQWVFFPNKKPRQMMNDCMHWRRPTYEDAIIRQEVYDSDPERFVRICEERSIENRKYLR